MTGIEYYVSIALIMCAFVAFAGWVDYRANNHKYYKHDAQSMQIQNRVDEYRNDLFKGHIVQAIQIVLFTSGAYLVVEGMVDQSILAEFGNEIVTFVGTMTFAFLLFEGGMMLMVENYMREQYIHGLMMREDRECSDF